MDEVTRKKVLEIIKKSLDEVVYDEMRRVPETIKKRQEEIKKTKSQRAQDAHDALFGKDEEMNYKLKLHEGQENPKITTNELEQFDKEFKSRFPGISFEKQPGNAQIVGFPIKNGQKDAITSGKITTGESEIGFTMSLINGFKINSIIEGGKIKPFEIKKETKDVFGKILNLYEEIFKKRFNDIINPTEQSGEEELEMGENPPSAPPTATPQPTASVNPTPSV